MKSNEVRYIKYLHYTRQAAVVRLILVHPLHPSEKIKKSICQRNADKILSIFNKGCAHSESSRGISLNVAVPTPNTPGQVNGPKWEI